MVEFGGITKSGDEIIEEPVGGCLASFIPGGVGLREPGEVVHHYQDILASTPGGLQAKEIDTHQLEGGP